MTDVKPAPEEQTIIDASDLRKYRTELPNLYDDSDLDPYEYRLLGHYKRVGICRESLPTTAKKCRMSEGQVSKKRQSLANKTFIKLERVDMGGKRYRLVIRVIDRWIENFSRYSGLTIEEITEQVKKGSPSPREGSPSPREGSPSPREGKKELIKNFNDRFSAVSQKLSQLQGGGLNSASADLIETWLEKHSDDWIFKAIDLANYNSARHQNYVDKVLIGWEANGYPQSREEKVQGAKNGSKPKAGNRQRTKQPGRKEADIDYSQADLDAAAEINASVP